MKRLSGKALLALPIALLLGCSAESGGDEMAQEDGMSMEMAGVEFAIEVTNPMSHEMVVYVVYAEAETRLVQLGTVPANETASLTFTASAAMVDLELRASDAGMSHSVTGTVQLMEGKPATWTIGQ